MEATVERFAVCIIRSNGKDKELLSQMHETREAAERDAQKILGWVQMVQAEVVGPFNVPLVGKPFDLNLDAFLEEAFPKSLRKN